MRSEANKNTGFLGLIPKWIKYNIKKLFTLVQQHLKNNQTVAVSLPTYYTLFLLSNIAIIICFVNFHCQVVHHGKKEKIANVCFFIKKILCIYILLFHGSHNKNFESLSPFNPSIYHPFIATPHFSTFYLIALPLLFGTLDNPSCTCLNVMLY